MDELPRWNPLWYVERLLAKGGRKFALCVFGIINASALSVLSLLVLMFGPPAAMQFVGAIVLGFTGVLTVALGFYTGSNAHIEATHAKAGTAAPKAPPTPRPSGSVVPPDGVPADA